MSKHVMTFNLMFSTAWSAIGKTFDELHHKNVLNVPRSRIPLSSTDSETGEEYKHTLLCFDDFSLDCLHYDNKGECTTVYMYLTYQECVPLYIQYLNETILPFDAEKTKQEIEAEKELNAHFTHYWMIPDFNIYVCLIYRCKTDTYEIQIQYIPLEVFRKELEALRLKNEIEKINNILIPS